MDREKRTSGKPAGPSPGKNEVVRLPVPEADLSDRLQAMPIPQRVERLQPNPKIVLVEEEAEEPVELSPADLGMPWEEEEASKTQTPVGWLVLIGLLLVAVGGWALGKLPKGKERFDEQVEEVRELGNEEEREHEHAIALLARVEELTRGYLLADKVEEKLSFVRHPDRIRPMMKEYYERHEFEPLHYESLTEFSPIGLENRSFFMVAAKVKEGGTIRLFAEQTAGGELKFDWESEVAYLPMKIEDFLATKPTEPLDFRVYARLDNFYSYEFSNPDEYQAVMLTLRDSEEFLFGYIKRGTDDELALIKYLSQEITVRKPALLRLRFLPGTRARRSVLVEKFVAPRWVHVEDPATDK